MVIFVGNIAKPTCALSYGAVHLATACFVQNFPTCNNKHRLYSSWQNFPFEDTNKSPRGIFNWLKIEQEILLLMTQIGAYVKLDFSTNQQCSERAFR